jgi:hypothetical protein
MNFFDYVRERTEEANYLERWRPIWNPENYSPLRTYETLGYVVSHDVKFQYCSIDPEKVKKRSVLVRILVHEGYYSSIQEANVGDTHIQLLPDAPVLLRKKHFGDRTIIQLYNFKDCCLCGVPVYGDEPHCGCSVSPDKSIIRGRCTINSLKKSEHCYIVNINILNTVSHSRSIKVWIREPVYLELHSLHERMQEGIIKNLESKIFDFEAYIQFTKESTIIRLFKFKYGHISLRF